MIEFPPICLCDAGFFVGVRRIEDGGEWLYVLVGGPSEEFTLHEIQSTWAPLTWFDLVESPSLDPEAAL